MTMEETLHASLTILADGYHLKQGKDKEEFEELCKQYNVDLKPFTKMESKSAGVIKQDNFDMQIFICGPFCVRGFRRAQMVFHNLQCLVELSVHKCR